ncbi:MAG: ComEC/Rec2 family competence protein [Ignavibacteria bacterium]
MIPTLFIVLFMLQGMGLNSMLDIRIDSVYLLIMSIFMAFLSMFLPIGKFPSTLLLGMCIHAESDSMKVNGTKGHAIRTKAIAKGRIQEISEKSNFTQCIIEGYIDTPQLPRIEHCRILLRITGSRSALKEGMNIQVRGIASNPDKTELRGEFDQMNYLQSKNIQFLIMVKETAIIQSTNNDIHSSIRFIREWIDIALSRVFPKESVPLVKGIVLGETSDISSDLRNAFALLGTAHILSVSGFHAGIIALLILFLLSWIPSLIIRNVLLILSLLVFLEIVHWDPPAIRACMMTSLGYTIFSLQRKAHGIHVLLTVGGFMISLDPTLLSSIGFQMSMAGMFGLIFLPQYLHAFHQRIFPKSIAHSLSTSISAMLILLPLTAWYFEMISFISPIANLMFIPMFTIALCWTIIAVICFSFSVYLAELFAMAAHQVIAIADELHIQISTLDWIAYRGEFSIWMSLMIIASILIVYRSKNRIQFLISGICSLIFMIGMHEIYEETRIEEKKKIQFFRRKDILVGLIGKDILLLDRDRMRFKGNDIALIQYIVKHHNASQLIYSGKAAKQIAISIQALDTTFRMKECNRETMRLCLNILNNSIESGE